MKLNVYIHFLFTVLSCLPLVSAADTVKITTWGECEAIEILPSRHRRPVFERGRNEAQAIDNIRAYCVTAHRCIEEKCKTKIAAQQFIGVNPISLSTAPGEIDEVKSILEKAVLAHARKDSRFDLSTLEVGVYSRYPNNDVLREDLQGYTVRVEVSTR